MSVRAVPINTTRATAGAGSSAVFSENGLHRYSLTRRWTNGPAVMFIGLNPSTADEKNDDPTIRRCIGFAKSWDCGALYMGNAFSYRATDPREMAEAREAGIDINGKENDHWLRTLAGAADIIVAAWGAHLLAVDRGLAVAELIGPRLQCLGTTQSGQPRHPLYLKRDTLLAPWPSS